MCITAFTVVLFLRQISLPFSLDVFQNIIPGLMCMYMFILIPSKRRQLQMTDRIEIGRSTSKGGIYTTFIKFINKIKPL